jgi:thiamine-phosphate pyrophosphorylase
VNARLPDPPLLLVTDRQQARLPLAEVVGAALAAGCRWVSMREKDLPEYDQYHLAMTLLPIARRHGARLTVHGEAALARSFGVDGVHLPAGSDPAAARKLFGPDKLIGVSIHTVAEAEALVPGVIDYAVAGPTFETPSKPGYGPEIGRKGLAEIAAAARVPILAIGGLNATRAAEVLAVGPAGIAVMGGVMRSPDPGREVRGLLSVLAESYASHAAKRAELRDMLDVAEAEGGNQTSEDMRRRVRDHLDRLKPRPKGS